MNTMHETGVQTAEEHIKYTIKAELNRINKRHPDFNQKVWCRF